MAKYKDIADDIRNRVASGEYSVGERIPSLQQLMREYSAAQHTMQGALKILREEGILQIVQGLPTVVVKAPDMNRVSVLDKLRSIQREVEEAIRLVEEG